MIPKRAQAEKKKAVIGVLICLLLIPFPIDVYYYCSSTDVSYEITNVLLYIIGFNDCYSIADYIAVYNTTGEWCYENGYNVKRGNSTTNNWDCMGSSIRCEYKRSIWIDSYVNFPFMFIIFLVVFVSVYYHRNKEKI